MEVGGEGEGSDKMLTFKCNPSCIGPCAVNRGPVQVTVN